MASELSSLGELATTNGELGTRFRMLSDSWDHQINPEGYVNLGVAENTLMREELTEYLQQNSTVTQAALTYGEGGVGSLHLRRAAARFMTRHFKPMKPIRDDSVVITNGCSSSIEHCSFLLADPGEVFLLGQPYYTTFIDDLAFRTGRGVVAVPFHGVDPCSVEAIVCYETALRKVQNDGKRAKGLVLCNPHNPLGRCYPRETIIGLMELCQKNRMHFISDEIYALSVWDNDEEGMTSAVGFASASSINTSGVIDAHLVHVLWGISKDFGANGLRLGMIVSQGNPNFIKALEVVSLYSYPSRLADTVVAGLLDDVDFTNVFIDENRKRLARNYRFATRFLRLHNIEYSSGTNAGFFLWVNLGKAYLFRHGNLPQQQLADAVGLALQRFKVYCNNGDIFGSEEPGWFRCIFAVSETCLREGLNRMLKALDHGATMTQLQSPRDD